MPKKVFVPCVHVLVYRFMARCACHVAQNHDCTANSNHLIVVLNLQEVPKRALVVGMNDYKPESGLNPLKNGVPDARAIKKMLRDQGVEVFYGENLTMDEYNALEEKYLDALQKGDIGVIFFAAHAFTFNGASHVVTITDAEPDLSKHAVNVLKLNIRLTD